MEKILIAGGFVIFYGVIFISGIVKKRKGLVTSGRPPLRRPVFVAGKAAMGASWIIMVLQVAGIDLRQLEPGNTVTWSAVMLFYIGLMLCIPVYFHLGSNLKFGLPESGESRLCMRGLYRAGRNPMYLGFYCMTMASCLYVPSVLNVLCACIGIAIHHLTVLSEEKYLTDEHGDEYLEYMARVRRYL